MSQYFECPNGHRVPAEKAKSVICHCSELFVRITKLPRKKTESKADEKGKSGNKL